MSEVYSGVLALTPSEFRRALEEVRGAGVEAEDAWQLIRYGKALPFQRDAAMRALQRIRGLPVIG